MAPKKLTSLPFLSDTVYNKLTATHVSLLKNGLYLRDPTLQTDKKLTWHQIRNDKCLILCDLSHNAKDGSTQKTLLDTAIGDNTIKIDMQQYTPDILSAIVHITTEDFWMSSCGGWHGSTKFCPNFQDLKLTCTGHVPTELPFADDFQTTIKKP